MDDAANGSDNVILFPKTVEYYQLKLTRLLEKERYHEAEELLRFLVNCRASDRQTLAEWHSLLEWLEKLFPDMSEAEEETADLTEADIHRLHIREKAKDQQYTKKLLEMLLNGIDPEKKLLALEQLAVIDLPHIDETLKRWLETVELHPIVQFKVLQTLKKRGMTGTVSLERNKERLCLSIEETPLQSADFPRPFNRMLAAVSAVSETHQPALAFFAEQLWNEFLAAIYGTSLYRQVADIDEAHTQIWACALHCTVNEAMTGAAEIGEMLPCYGLQSSDEKLVQTVCKKIKACL
ncbi:MAG TPA: hypothetical protein VF260_08565 [Bacilli bacterium]